MRTCGISALSFSISILEVLRQGREANAKSSDYTFVPRLQAMGLSLELTLGLADVYSSDGCPSD